MKQSPQLSNSWSGGLSSNFDSVNGDASRIWLLLSDKLGDNMQARMVADAMALSFTDKFVAMKEAWVLGKPGFKPSIDHIDLDKSDPLEPPWPETIITVGRRPAMVALWIRQQAAKLDPAKRVKIVQVGRAKRKLDAFDLVIAAPQFQIQPANNVMHLDLPLIRVDRARVDQAAQAWKEPLASLPKPLTAMMIGGPTRPFDMPREVIENAVNAIRQSDPNGTLFITTSRRTPPNVTDYLRSMEDQNTRLFAWQPDAIDNPYHGLLAHAHRFAVTGDSMSMMMEVADLQKPLAIIGLPVTRNLNSLILFMARRLARRFDPKGRFGSPRDLRNVHQKLFEMGAATPIEQGFPQGPFQGLNAEYEKIGDRMRSVIEAS